MRIRTEITSRFALESPRSLSLAVFHVRRRENTVQCVLLKHRVGSEVLLLFKRYQTGQGFYVEPQRAHDTSVSGLGMSRALLT